MHLEESPAAGRAKLVDGKTHLGAVTVGREPAEYLGPSPTVPGDNVLSLTLAPEWKGREKEVADIPRLHPGGDLPGCPAPGARPAQPRSHNCDKC